MNCNQIPVPKYPFEMVKPASVTHSLRALLYFLRGGCTAIIDIKGYHGVYRGIIMC